MPGLGRISRPSAGPSAGVGHEGAPRRPFSGGEALRRMFPRCGNSGCGSGPIRLWRSRSAPMFEGRWACSPECLGTMVEAAMGRERHGGGAGAEWTHRIPLRLMLLGQGRISEEQLREAVRRPGAQADGEASGLEEWLGDSGLLSETALTRAISAQWNCPVFSLSATRPEEMGWAVPPFLAEALGALPVRISGGKLLYLAFSEGIDRSLSYAVEHMTGLRVSGGIARESEFRREQARFLSAAAPRTRFLEAGNQPALARGISAWIEEQRPIAARLARVHEVWWLRIWQREPRGASLGAPAAVEDLLATVGAAPENGN